MKAGVLEKDGRVEQTIQGAQSEAAKPKLTALRSDYGDQVAASSQLLQNVTGAPKGSCQRVMIREVEPAIRRKQFLYDMLVGADSYGVILPFTGSKQLIHRVAQRHTECLYQRFARMAETTNRIPGEVETLNYQVSGVDEGAVQVKKNRSPLFRQLLPFASG